jgi:hypothetical protein
VSVALKLVNYESLLAVGPSLLSRVWGLLWLLCVSGGPCPIAALDGHMHVLLLLSKKSVSQEYYPSVPGAVLGSRGK